MQVENHSSTLSFTACKISKWSVLKLPGRVIKVITAGSQLIYEAGKPPCRVLGERIYENLLMMGIKIPKGLFHIRCACLLALLGFLGRPEKVITQSRRRLGQFLWSSHVRVDGTLGWICFELGHFQVLFCIDW